MPDIKAIYGNIEVTGRNAENRPDGDTAPPSDAIKRVCPQLAVKLGNLDKEARSAYACAEAQALAKILEAIPAQANYDKIVFTRPTEADGKILWEPCRNCSQWLVPIPSFWGSQKTYRLSDEVLGMLPKVQIAAPSAPNLADDFPTFAQAKAQGFKPK